MKKLNKNHNLNLKKLPNLKNISTKTLTKCQESPEVNIKKFTYSKHKDQKMKNGHLWSKELQDQTIESALAMLLFNAHV